MHSWVRYSVSAYIGLLLAGSLVNPDLAPASTEPMAFIPQDRSPIPMVEPPMLHRTDALPDALADQARS